MASMEETQSGTGDTFGGPRPDSKVPDPKRWAWLVGGVWTLGLPLVAGAIYFATGGALWTVVLLPLHIFVVIPAVDAIVGESRQNPSARLEKQMVDDRFYMRVVHFLVLFSYVPFFAGVWFVTTQGLPLWANIVTLYVVGLHNGSIITLAHELGHKTHKMDRLMAKLALGAIGYGHFTVEHNVGHHKNVSTPEDCASARMGESLYGFALRELPGAAKGGWAIEARRLQKRGLAVFSRHNEILQSYAITMAVTLGLVVWLGMAALPWILLHNFSVWFALTTVNYIEHYGLLRAKRPDGRYEPCSPRHSWNTDHIVSNVLQIQLQRHSDHHAHPMRPYQTLRSLEGAPHLPSGYPGCIGLASIPFLWGRVMDPKVMAWADGDLRKVNLHEPARARLEAKWGAAPSVAPSIGAG